MQKRNVDAEKRGDATVAGFNFPRDVSFFFVLFHSNCYLHNRLRADNSYRTGEDTRRDSVLRPIFLGVAIFAGLIAGCILFEPGARGMAVALDRRVDVRRANPTPGRYGDSLWLLKQDCGMHFDKHSAISSASVWVNTFK